ncbi:hypothetical protein I41_27150 [Lacipirellula limnantheis]|uniref:Uncharacterized protein n=1 Tax=Lacipirellula limnantheis TaxID=2528024 RepID=A0A517TYS8_9BACT|nr:hypothetical protein I41_27150 [Lacipirellula limnantheis]
MSKDCEPEAISPGPSANVGGTIFSARSITEAAALNLAGDILDEVKPKRRQPDLIHSLAMLLDDHGLRRAANTLRERYRK